MWCDPVSHLTNILQELISIFSPLLVSALSQLDVADIIPPVNIVKPTINIPTISVPTSSWKPDNFATWPFITITGVSGNRCDPVPPPQPVINHISASNITYLLVSLFILYVGIILYVDGDYLYNKVKDFAIGRCKYYSPVVARIRIIRFIISVSRFQRNIVRRVHTGVGLNTVTDTLTSAWDAMRANFGVSPSAAAPHGWVAPRPQRRPG